MGRLSFHEEFYNNQHSNEFYLRMRPDKKAGRQKIVTEKKGVWTWIKANILDRKSYNLQEIFQVLGGIELTPKEYQALRNRISLRKGSSNNKSLLNLLIQPSIENILKEAHKIQIADFTDLGEASGELIDVLISYAQNNLSIINPKFELVPSGLTTGLSGHMTYLVKDSQGILHSVFKVYEDLNAISSDATTMQIVKPLEGSDFSFTYLMGLAKWKNQNGKERYCLAQTPARGASMASLFENVQTAENRQEAIENLKKALESAGRSIAQLHQRTMTTPALQEILSEKKVQNNKDYRDFFRNGLKAATAIAQERSFSLFKPSYFEKLLEDSSFLEEEPTCIIHGDFQPGNIFFDLQTEHSTLIDLDLCADSIDLKNFQAIGSPFYDLAYLSQWVAILGFQNEFDYSEEITSLRKCLETAYFDERKKEANSNLAIEQKEFRFMQALVSLKYIYLLQPEKEFYTLLGAEKAASFKFILLLDLVSQQVKD